MDEIDRLRAFNRFYTARMALLGQSYLGSGTPLAEVRVLHDLAEGATTARRLAADLRLDEGYLSRILGRMERQGWLRREVSRRDRRQRDLHLTQAGAARAAEMRRLSRAEIAGLLDGVPVHAIRAAARAAGDVQAALSLDHGDIRLRDLAPGDAGWIVERHGTLYARDEGYDMSFEALVARIVAGFVETRDPGAERAWIAEAGGRRLGCIFCVRVDDATAKLRLFLVDPEARGTGLGRLLLQTCIGYARDRGYRRMVLWTHESHRAACALYAKAGWRLVTSTPGRQFGVAVVDQGWEIDL